MHAHRWTGAALALTLLAGPVEAAMTIPVTFDSAGQTLHGDLYLPDGYTAGARLPAVVVTGSWTSVKAQMPATYAKAMADRGYAALAFDFRGWGQSKGGTPFLEDPARKTADIRAAVDFLAARPEVDPARLGGLGICASAGYMVTAAADEPRLRAVSLVAPWLHDREIVEAVYGGAEGVAALEAKGRAAAAAKAPVLIEAASTTNADALMFKAPYYTEPTRGLIAAYDNQFNVASWGPWLGFDALAAAERPQPPTLLVHSKAAAIPQGAEAYAARLGDRARTVWLPAVTQFDFYDQPAAVTRAVTESAGHFTRVFAAQADVAAVETVVHSVAHLVDLQQFELLGSLYAPEIVVDYESLNGKPPETRPSAGLMKEWGALLPGFDRTRHVLDAVTVRIDGETARATANVRADHYVDGLFWSCEGRYTFELKRLAGRWRITLHRLTVERETGTRDVFGAATKRAAR